MNNEPTAWTVAVEFKVPAAPTPTPNADANRGIVLQVSKSNHYPFPRYSIGIGFRVNEHFMSRTFSPRVEGQHVLAPQVDSSIKDVAALLRQAEEWIVTDAASESGTYVEEREKRDRKAATGPGAPARTTGKTERDRAKRQQPKAGG